MIALIILTGVIVVSMQSRAQVIAAERSVRVKLSAYAVLESVLELREAGALGSPAIDDESGVQTWQGEHAGTRFSLRRELIESPTPAALSEDEEDPESISLWRTTLETDVVSVSILEHH